MVSEYIRFISINTLGICTADARKVRIIAQADRELRELTPYVAASMPRGSYTPETGTVWWKTGLMTYSVCGDGRVTITQLRDKEEATEKLEELRLQLNRIWNERDKIDPNAPRRRITALGLYKFLPKKNCGKCGEKTCMAFAMSLITGAIGLDRCIILINDAVGYKRLSNELQEAGYDLSVSAPMSGPPPKGYTVASGYKT